MTSLFLIPLVFLFLRGKKSNTAPNKELSISTGLVFTNRNIAILDKKAAYFKIDSLILNFSKTSKENIDDVNIPDLFEYIVKTLNPVFYTKMINRKVTHTEKMILSLFFIIVFNRLLTFVKDPEEYSANFEYNISKTILHVIGLTTDDKDDIELVNEDFKKTLKYP
jgi:hypothetical protein